MSSPQANPWRRVSRRVAYENPWIEILHDDVIRPDDKPGIYGVVHFRHLAIGVVPLDTATDRVLLVGQFRYTMNHYSWEIPEGGGDFDEFPEAAARRELAEETGYVGGEWRELCRAELSNSVTDEVTIPFDEVMAMIAGGEIADAMSILAIQALALERAAARG